MAPKSCFDCWQSQWLHRLRGLRLNQLKDELSNIKHRTRFNGWQSTCLPSLPRLLLNQLRDASSNIEHRTHFDGRQSPCFYCFQAPPKKKQSWSISTLVSPTRRWPSSKASLLNNIFALPDLAKLSLLVNFKSLTASSSKRPNHMISEGTMPVVGFSSKSIRGLDFLVSSSSLYFFPNLSVFA
jgi:hypothetical protein